MKPRMSLSGNTRVERHHEGRGQRVGRADLDGACQTLGVSYARESSLGSALNQVSPFSSQARRRKTDAFRVHPAPHVGMERPVGGWAFRAAGPAPNDLEPLVSWFEREPNSRERFRWVFRDALDDLLDGQRTGRWAYQHLSKTEKTHLGTIVEIKLTKEFEFENGADLDWRIGGEDIDCKFSKDRGGWEIPMEMYLCEDHGSRQGKCDHPALVTWMNDDTSEWAVGIVRVSDVRLRWRKDKTTQAVVRAYNGDNKRRIDPAHADTVHWLWGGVQRDLPPNLLLHLPPDARTRIFSNPRSGQARVNQMFREVQGVAVGRQTVLTVAQQDDAPKRARDARKHLRDEGILILGHQRPHAAVAYGLGLPVPVRGEWVATRVVPVDAPQSRFSVEYEGRIWAVARDDEPPFRAFELPRT